LFVIEAKLDKPVKEAIQQIEEKRYAMLLDTIKQIVAKEGEEILSEPRKVSAFFSDLAKDEPKPQKQAFVKCLEYGFAKILKGIAKEDRDNCKENLANRLCNEEPA
jgi:hypothetical protein